jgi:hypothetical protein
MNNKTGETDLEKLIANMEPILNEGDYVFATVLNVDQIPRSITVCEIKEKEGITVVLPKKDADSLGLKYEFIASWITLNIHSSLEAVGLTAAFSTELGNNGISCNVIAGYYHDHIFVDKKDQEKAINVLQSMSKKS